MKPKPTRRARKRTTERQVHVWMSHEDYASLVQIADQRGESISALLRRSIRRWRDLSQSSQPRP